MSAYQALPERTTGGPSPLELEVREPAQRTDERRSPVAHRRIRDAGAIGGGRSGSPVRSHPPRRAPARAAGSSRRCRPRPAAARAKEPTSRGAAGSLAQRLEVVEQVLGPTVTPVRVLLQAVDEDAIELARQVGASRRDRRRIVAQDRRGELGRGGAHKGPLSGSHLVEDDAEREQVRGARRPRHPGLFRRHVGIGAHDGAGLGQLLRRCFAVHLPRRRRTWRARSRAP